MERIKKALERAKQERESKAGGDVAETVQPTAKSPSAPRSDVRADKIVYTETHVVDVDEAVLDRNRVLGGKSQFPVWTTRSWRPGPGSAQFATRS